MNDIKIRLKKTYLKLLKACTRGKMNKAHRLNQKIIQLELEIKRLDNSGLI